jgi:hypothetical protein
MRNKQLFLCLLKLIKFQVLPSIQKIWGLLDLDWKGLQPCKRKSRDCMGLQQTSCPIRARLLLQKLISLSLGWMPPGGSQGRSGTRCIDTAVRLATGWTTGIRSSARLGNFPFVTSSTCAGAHTAFYPVGKGVKVAVAWSWPLSFLWCCCLSTDLR